MMEVDSRVCSQPVILHDGVWQRYDEFARVQQVRPTILFIRPGMGCLWESGDLRDVCPLHHQVVVTEDPREQGYDCSDPACSMPGWETGPDSWDMAQKNLATYGRDVVLEQIKSLVKSGDGPVAVVCGSRGGDVTIREVWRAWHGPTLMLNGSCLRPGLENYVVPASIPLYVATGSRDIQYFPQRGSIHAMIGSYNQTAVPLRSDREQKYGTRAPVPDGLGVNQVLLYHSDEGHNLRSLAGDVLKALLELMVSGSPLKGKALKRFVQAATRNAAVNTEIWLVEQEDAESNDSCVTSVSELHTEIHTESGNKYPPGVRVRVARLMAPGVGAELCRSLKRVLPRRWCSKNRVGDGDLTASLSSDAAR